MTNRERENSFNPKIVRRLAVHLLSIERISPFFFHGRRPQCYTVKFCADSPYPRAHIHVHLAASERSNLLHFPAADRGCRDRSDNSRKSPAICRGKERQDVDCEVGTYRHSKLIIPGMETSRVLRRARLMISVYRPTTSAGRCDKFVSRVIVDFDGSRYLRHCPRRDSLTSWCSINSIRLTLARRVASRRGGTQAGAKSRRRRPQQDFRHGRLGGEKNLIGDLRA